MNTFFAWLNGPEVVVLLVIVLVLFGAKKLPELARGLGQGIREFKKSTRDVQDEFQTAMDVDHQPPPPQPRKLPPQTEVRADYPQQQPSSQPKA
jgi:sec-independent protein translocase protein TatA